MAWGYITIPITVKRLYGLVFACYGKDTESKQPKPIVVNFDNEEKVEARENDDAGAKQRQARKEHYYTGERKRFYFTDKRIVDTLWTQILSLRTPESRTYQR